MNISLSAFVPENLVSRDGFGSPVPRQPAHLHTTQTESVAYLRDSSRVPRRRPFIARGHSDTCGLLVGILYSKVSEISVWWSGFRPLQDVSKEAQPGDLPAKYLDDHEAPAIIERKNKLSCVAFLLCDPGWFIHILYRKVYSLTSRINGMTKTYGEQRHLYS